MAKNNSITRYALIASALLTFAAHAHESHSLIGEMESKINKDFIQLKLKSFWTAVREVFVASQGEKKPSGRFKDFLDDKNNVKIMRKITEIAKDGTTGTSLDALNMQKKIKIAFKTKRESLYRDHSFYACQTIPGTLGIFLVGAATVGLSNNCDVRRAVTQNGALGIGGLLILASGINGYYANVKQASVEKTINQISKMKSSWKNVFKKSEEN